MSKFEHLFVWLWYIDFPVFLLWSEILLFICWHICSIELLRLYLSCKLEIRYILWAGSLVTWVEPVFAMLTSHMGVLVGVLTVQLLIQLRDKMLEKAVDDGRSSGMLPLIWEPGWVSRLPVLAWTSLAIAVIWTVTFEAKFLSLIPVTLPVK